MLCREASAAAAAAAHGPPLCIRIQRQRQHIHMQLGETDPAVIKTDAMLFFPTQHTNKNEFVCLMKKRFLSDWGVSEECDGLFSSIRSCELLIFTIWIVRYENKTIRLWSKFQGPKWLGPILKVLDKIYKLIL